jgi:hypothetical protein
MGAVQSVRSRSACSRGKLLNRPTMLTYNIQRSWIDAKDAFHD